MKEKICLPAVEKTPGNFRYPNNTECQMVISNKQNCGISRERIVNQEFYV